VFSFSPAETKTFADGQAPRQVLGLGLGLEGPVLGLESCGHDSASLLYAMHYRPT